MNIRVAAIGLCLFSACSISSPQPGKRPGEQPYTPSAVAVDRGPLPASPRAQDDYSPSSLFMAAHDKFMMHKELWRPDIRVSVLSLAHGEVNGEDGHFDLLRIDADFETRMYLDRDTFATFGGQFSQRQYRFSSSAMGADDENLTRATVNLGIGYFLDGEADTTLLELNFNPGLWTDFDGTLTGDDWKFYSSGLVTWRHSPDLYIKLGAEHSGLFRDVDAYPLFGLAWSLNDEWRLDMLLPRQIRMTYGYNSPTSVYAGVDLDGGGYNIRTPTPGQIERDVNVQELIFSLGVEHRYNQSLSLFARVGSTLAGDYHIRNSGPAEYGGQLDLQFIAEVGMGWTF